MKVVTVDRVPVGCAPSPAEATETAGTHQCIVSVYGGTVAATAVDRDYAAE